MNALDHLIHAPCGEEMAATNLLDGRHVYVCGPECGSHEYLVDHADTEVFSTLTTMAPWLDRPGMTLRDYAPHLTTYIDAVTLTEMGTLTVNPATFSNTSAPTSTMVDAHAWPLQGTRHRKRPGGASASNRDGVKGTGYPNPNTNPPNGNTHTDLIIVGTFTDESVTYTVANSHPVGTIHVYRGALIPERLVLTVTGAHTDYPSGSYTARYIEQSPRWQSSFARHATSIYREYANTTQECSQ